MPGSLTGRGHDDQVHAMERARARKSVAMIHATARLSGFLYRRLTPLYLALYDAYKRVSERDEIALIRRFVRPGDRVVDVGANVGFYAEVLARCVGPGGRVYAFEPDTANYQRLAARARAYPQIETVPAAVAARSGAIDLFLSPDLNVDHRTYATDEARRAVPVDAVSLDDFLADREATLHFVKMDIQGAEYDALLGMQATIARSPAVRILMEVWPFAHDRFGVGTARLLGLLEAWGFDIRRVGSRGEVREKLDAAARLPESGEPDAYFNVLCVRPDAPRPVA